MRTVIDMKNHAESNQTETLAQFDSLLAVWNDHQQLRSEGASIDELFASRATLDEARLTAAKLSTAS